MSRLARKPIMIPDGVTLDVAGGIVRAKGAKGELSASFGDAVRVVVKDREVWVERDTDSRDKRAMQGTVYSRVRAMIEGVSSGFKKTLELNGVGFRVAKKGNDLELTIGFSHPVLFKVASGVSVEVEKNTIRVEGIDKQLVGEVAANIRKQKKPEPFKGKGIKYTTEVVRRKAGKAGKAGA